MRRIKLIVALGVVIAAMLALSAAPALADDGRHHNDRDHRKHNDHHHNKKHNDHHHKKFFDDEHFVDVEVDFEKVPLRSALVGECVVTDIDGNGFVDDWEVEVTCFVPRRWYW